MSEAEERKHVVALAKAWMGTPYHHSARKKGHGVDCAQLLYAVYFEAGLIPPFEIGAYSPQWHLNRNAEKYLDAVLQYAHEVTDRDPLPGDVVVWRFGRTFSHGAIVIDWPHIVHAYINQGCTLENAQAATWLKYIGENSHERGNIRPMRLFSCWK